jgi:3-oxoacyl-[acyl-carrier-protein] synthase III
MTALLNYLSGRLREVQERLGLEPHADPDTPFADLVDSMGLVELVGLVATDCAVGPDAIEQAVARRFTTLTELAEALHAAGIGPRAGHLAPTVSAQTALAPVWLAGVQLALPGEVQSAEQLDALLHRPPGWLEQHAGISSRGVWAGEDALEAARQAAASCLQADGCALAALLVTSEAPPRPVGLAAALHARLGLPPDVPALEVGGACTGLLHALWLGRRLVRPNAAVLIVAVEAPSAWLQVRPGPEGEAAALFGDAAGACLLTTTPAAGALPVGDVVLGCDGAAGDIVRLRLDTVGPVLDMDGPALALRAVRHLCGAVEQVCAAHGLKPADLGGVYVHAGNGRLPALVAQKLGVEVERVHATTAWTGNLGSVSLLAALAQGPPRLPAVCAAVGAGLCWGAALVTGLAPPAGPRPS